MKKLMILGGAAAHCQVVERAREMGIHTIVTDYLPLEDAPAKQMADESLQINITDTAALVDYIRRNKVDGVMNYCLDPCTVPAYEVASRCGLPTFGTREQVMTLGDKELFKECSLRLGLPVLRSYTLEDIRQGSVPYPVMVKPRIGRGSRGVKVCSDAKEVLDAIQAMKLRRDSTSGYIIEEYASHEDCPFVLAQYIICKGESYLVFFSVIYDGSKEYGMGNYYSCVCSSPRLLDIFLKTDNEVFKGFIRKLGIMNGGLMLQSYYKDGHFRTVDVGFRFPGSGHAKAIKDALGLDLIEPMINYAMGGEMCATKEIKKGMEMFEGKFGLEHHILLRPGTIGHISGFDEIRKHPQVFCFDEKCHEGTVIPSSGDSRQDGGGINCFVKKDAQALKEIVEFIDKTLVITDTEGRDMIIHTDNYMNMLNSL